ncbi:iron complex transport system substrate-binding protein [Methylohalomonas lacus]|uniref:Iron complex transport system substrate-binding protein n=1 Tax=Methylohalomonas lacus TaxID=398773 RepID=A0AAE3HLY5_9GAMM|nr:iron complex transport system substrate-binding protein [Methylohalomonas lacus]
MDSLPRVVPDTFTRLTLFAGLLLLASAGSAVQVTDATGQRLELAQPATRIVSLAPHLTELLFAIGAGDTIIATVSHSDYPAAARNIPRIGNYTRFDNERLVALQPDLVLGWQSGNPAGQLQRLRALGLAVHVSEPRQLTDIARLLETLGKLTGHRATATSAADDYRARLAALHKRYRDRPPISVFYQIWHQPLITVGGAHVLNEVIELCGGRNVFATSTRLAPRVATEAVLAARPQVIVASGPDGQRPQWLDDWRHWSQLPAVRDEHLYHINPDHLQRHSPRILDGTAQLCRILEEARG